MIKKLNKKFIYLVIISTLIILITGCSTNIIPSGYIDVEHFSNQNIEQINNTLQYSIYTYDETPDMSKNRFLEKVDDDTKVLLDFYLDDFEVEIKNYDFATEYAIKISEITIEDYTYIDYKNDGKTEYFMIYLLDVSVNKLYYCYMMS